MKETRWLLALVVTVVLASGFACTRNTATTTTTEPAVTGEQPTTEAPTAPTETAPETGEEGTETTGE